MAWIHYMRRMASSAAPFNYKQKLFFRDNGYIKLSSVIGADLLEQAQKSFTVWRHELISGRRELLKNEHAQEAQISRSLPGRDSILPIREIVTSYAEALLGRGNVVLYDWKFIGWPPSREDWQEQWHIDDVNKCLRQTGINNFPGCQLIVGVPLSAIDTEESGGLVVSPGGHIDMAKHFKQGRSFEKSLQDLSRRMQEEPIPGKRTHLYEKPGDIIFLHELLPHGTAKNEGGSFADKIYFRFSCADLEKRSGLHAVNNLWGNWNGMEEVLAQ